MALGKLHLPLSWLSVNTSCCMCLNGRQLLDSARACSIPIGDGNAAVVLREPADIAGKAEVRTIMVCDRGHSGVTNLSKRVFEELSSRCLATRSTEVPTAD